MVGVVFKKVLDEYSDMYKNKYVSFFHRLILHAPS